MTLLNSSNYPVYDLPTDKVTGTWSTDGTVDSLFPLTNIDSIYPWVPVKFTVNPSFILCDHGTPKRMDVVPFIHCGPFDAPVHVKRGATSAALSMDVIVSGTGVTEDLMPTNPWVDLTAATGYNGATGYRYTRYEFSNTALLSLGLIRQTATLRQFAAGVQISAKDNEAFPDVSFSTYGSVQLGYTLGVRPRRISGQMTVDAAAYATLRSLWRGALGRHSPYLLILEPTVNESQWVKWGMDSLERLRIARGYQTISVAWDEVGRGLRP